MGCPWQSQLEEGPLPETMWGGGGGVLSETCFFKCLGFYFRELTNFSTQNCKHNANIYKVRLRHPWFKKN